MLIRTAIIALLLKFEQSFRHIKFRAKMFPWAGVPNLIRQAYVECFKHFEVCPLLDNGYCSKLEN